MGTSDVMVEDSAKKESSQGNRKNLHSIIHKNDFPTQRRSGEFLRLARDIIPQFDGGNMSVAMFIEHCRAAATGIEPGYIQDPVGIDFEELMRILETHFAPKLDTSQLMQELATITREKNKEIAEYGTRVNEILIKL